jgi:hypothetical protein
MGPVGYIVPRGVLNAGKQLDGAICQDKPLRLDREKHVHVDIVIGEKIAKGGQAAEYGGMGWNETGP